MRPTKSLPYTEKLFPFVFLSHNLNFYTPMSKTVVIHYIRRNKMLVPISIGIESILKDYRVLKTESKNIPVYQPKVLQKN